MLLWSIVTHAQARRIAATQKGRCFAPCVARQERRGVLECTHDLLQAFFFSCSFYIVFTNRNCCSFQKNILQSFYEINTCGKFEL